MSLPIFLLEDKQKIVNMDNSEKQERVDELVKTFVDGLVSLMELCEDGSMMEYTVKGSMASVVEEFRHPVALLRKQMQDSMRKIITNVTVGIKTLDRDLKIQVKVSKNGGIVSYTISKGDDVNHPVDINDKDIPRSELGERDFVQMIANKIREKLEGDGLEGIEVSLGDLLGAKPAKKGPDISKVLEEHGMAFLKDKWKDDLPFTIQVVQARYENTPNGDVLEVLAHLNKMNDE